MGQWNYFVGTYDGNTVSVYRNGILAASTPVPGGGSLSSYATNARIGALTNARGPGDFLPGKVDEVAIYNRALSSAEIQHIYQLQGASQGGATIQGNMIGTNAAGTAALANDGSGLSIFAATGNTIGGSAAGNGNIISANEGSGVILYGTGANYNTVAGNYIGVAADGKTALGNVSYGIDIFSGASGNTIGGTSPTSAHVIAPGVGSVSGPAAAYPGNLISGNSSGIAISGAGTNNNVVEGNFIGTDVTGGVAVPNITYGGGVDIFGGATGNIIGGTVDGSGNLISGNNNPSAGGVNISGTGTSNNIVEGNYIGTTGSGTAILGNGSAGVGVFGGASYNTIGTAEWGQARVSNAGNLGTPYGIVVASNGQIYVATDNNSIVQVDPVTGAQTILSSGGMLVGVYALTLNDTSIVATTLTSVVSVNTGTGAQTLVSDLTSGDEGPTVGPDGSLGIVREASGTYLISDFDNNRILRVDPATGNRTVVTSGTFLLQPEFLTLQADGTLLVASSGNGNVVKVNPTTGAQSVLGTYISPYALAVANDGSILVSDGSTVANSRLLRLDPTTGAATVVAQGGLFDSNFEGALAFESSGTLIAASQRDSKFTTSSLVRLTAGAARNVISGNGLPNGIVGWWRAEGDTVDSVGGNNGTVVGTVAYTTGKSGQAFNFTGNGYIQAPETTALLPSQITLDGWIKPVFTGRPSQSNDADVIINHFSGSGYELAVQMDPGAFGVPLGTPSFTLTVGGTTHILYGSTPIANDGLFHHVAGTFDGSTMTIFLDGVPDGIFTIAGSITYGPSQQVFIGHTDNFTPRNSQAAIDDVAIYSRALIPAEIQTIFDQGGGRYCQILWMPSCFRRRFVPPHQQTVPRR